MSGIFRALALLVGVAASMLASLPWIVRSVRADGLVCPELRESTAMTARPRHGRGVLWRIVKSGSAPSHVFGTIHLADDDLSVLPEPVATSFDQSRRLVIEVTLEDEDFEQWTKTIVAGNERWLRDQLGPALFDRSASLLSRYGIPTGVVDMMKPWAVYLTLSIPPGAAGLPLDLKLAMRAQQAGKPVSGLETVGEQIGQLAHLPADDQVLLVKDVVCNYDRFQQDIRSLKQRYLERDLAGLVAAAYRYELMEAPRYQRLMQGLLWERNALLVERMSGFLNDGGAFIAIGALHLPGDRGVLTLLERAGYTVESIY